MRYTTPHLVIVKGLPHWQLGNILLPIMAGGAPDEGEGGGTDGNGSGDDDDDLSAAGDTLSKAEVTRILRERLRRERAKYGDYETFKKSHEELAQVKQAQMSETEKLQARLKDYEGKEQTWQQEKRDLMLRSTIERTAATLGFHDPDAAYRLLDQGAIEYADDGTPKNTTVEKALKDLLKAKPYLGRPGGGSADGGSGQGGTLRGNDMNSIIRRGAGVLP